MRKLVILVSVLLLGSASAHAQDEAKTSATITPTSLPGEEELSAQERAERDFLMPTRRKRAAALEAVEEAARKAEAEAAAQTATASTEENPTKAPEAAAVPAETRKTVVKRKASGRR
ncbi:hypothetical protein KLP40_01360 [Hymenobacter sp. NST-14]|uniref:hypothetical protein n=1 Tax=Hymenobacter piscis TaxID=2839984 RepID=UPI001C0304C3|nr:hypothetical protein [Hymenobacter piscis]MBT9391795.1 hypothetical protein [Hymenobacter piscis]